MTFTPEQVTQLLQPINDRRVLSDGKGHAHVSQQDILAHLIRVFGFGGFDIEVLAVECIFEQGRTPEPVTRYDVCYRALVRLSVKDAAGAIVCTYENGSTATAQNQSRGDAHDLAYKSAISLSVKRAAIALGDQFGLSLYNKGQRTALVMGTMVGAPKGTQPPSRDMQEGVAQQVALGHDEADIPLEGDHKAERIKATPDDDPFYDTPPKPAGSRQASGPQMGKLNALLTELGYVERDAALAKVADIIGHPIATRNDLTTSEASKAIKALERIKEEPFPPEEKP
jgi:hypothetical protein